MKRPLSFMCVSCLALAVAAVGCGAIATEPELLLMDEPCSALDPIATRRIEELMRELRERFTIAIVTHNLQQAQRLADYTGFLYVDTTHGGRTGYLVEFGDSLLDEGRNRDGFFSTGAQSPLLFRSQRLNRIDGGGAPRRQGGGREGE